MLLPFLLITSIQLLLGGQEDRHVRQPENWQLLMGTGIRGNVKTLSETTYQQMSLMVEGKPVHRWDTLNARDYTFDDRGNLTTHKFRKRRPQNTHGEPAYFYYSDLLLYVDESYILDDSNNVVAASTWLQNGDITDNWHYNGPAGLHTTRYNDGSGDTERISVTYYDDVKLFEFSNHGCLTRRTFSAPGYDSITYYRDCGKNAKRITTYSKATEEGITTTTRMNFSNGLWAGSSTKTYNGRILEENILVEMGRISEQTIYSYDASEHLTTETVFDRNGKQQKKVTYAYDDKGGVIEETNYSTGKTHDSKTTYVNEYDDMRRLKKQTATTSYPDRNSVATPPTTKLIMGYDNKGNVLKEMTITMQGNTADTVIVTRQITYH